ncbi:hypothetical protein [Streptomyces zhihengii]|uniref:hypothetical protein n=1 Tax=Streptomyces zhihengii TaxID=1818004 RepID=UPI0033BB7C95
MIPDEAYDRNDIATIVVTGTVYGDTWVLDAIPTHLPPEKVKAIGTIEVMGVAGEADLVLKAAHAWLSTSVLDANLGLAHYETLNDRYGPNEAPYFTGAKALIDRHTRITDDEDVNEPQDG